jgi:predicted deacylase
LDPTIKRDAVYRPSDDLVAREIDGELVIVPIAAGIGDLEDELYTLNDTARAVWGRLDGRRTVDAVVDELSREYPGSTAEEIGGDVVGLLEELLRRRMVVAV